MKYSKVIFTLGVLTVLGIGVIAPFSQAKALTCNDIMSINATVDKDVYFFVETITGSISVENKLGATIPSNLNVGLYHEDVLEWSRKATVNIPVQGLNFSLADVFDFTPTASSDHIGNWTLKFIVKVGECEWTAEDVFEVVKSELSVCGNGVCEPGQGETGYICPQDCCVDNDGVCRDGCTSVIDNDCVGKKDPYMSHPNPVSDGYWLFCAFDEGQYIEGVGKAFVKEGYQDGSPGVFKHYNFLFTKDRDRPYDLRMETSIDDFHADPDKFNVRYIHDGITYMSMENKGRYYQIHSEDPENLIIQDFKVEPRNLHFVGKTYFGTLGSPVEGVVEIAGEKHEVTGFCTFEYAGGWVPESPPDVSLPKEVFSHYEPILLEDSDGNRISAIHWPWLATTGGYRAMRGGIDLPKTGYLSYPKSDYTLEYLEKTIIDGFNIPTKWKVTANTSEGILEYIGNTRSFSKVIPHPIFFHSMGDIIPILADYTGKFIYKDGEEIKLTGKGSVEFGYMLHDPMYNLDKRADHKFDFGNLTPMEGFKKVQYLTPYGPGGYGLAWPSLDGDSGDYDLTEFGNTGMHSDCAYLYQDKWIFATEVENGDYTVKLYWGKNGEKSTQTFNIYDGNFLSDTYDVEAENIGDASYPNEATIQHIQVDNGIIVIQMHRNSDTACMISAIEIIRESVVEPVCGNGICEPGEDGFTCPQDCCVDGDGICRKGCTSVIDNDCQKSTKQECDEFGKELGEKIYDLQFEGYEISWDVIVNGEKLKDAYRAEDYDLCMNYLTKLENSLTLSKKYKQYAFPTNVTKEDYLELGEEILRNALEHIEVGEKDGVPVYQMHPLFCGPLCCGKEDYGEEERMASVISTYIKITGNTTLDGKDLLEYVHGLCNRGIIDYYNLSTSHSQTPLPLVYVADALYMFGEDLSENILWNRLTDKEKQSWTYAFQAKGGWRIPNYNFNAFAAKTSYMAYRFGLIDSIDKSNYYLDELIKHYTDKNWLRDKDGFNIYSYFAAIFLKSMNNLKEINGDPIHREDRVDEIMNTMLEFIKYNARNTGDVWAFGRSADAYGESTFIIAEAFVETEGVEKGIFKRIAHIAFLMCKDRYFNETYGLVHPWQSPPRVLDFLNTYVNWGNVNAQFLMTLFGGYTLSDDDISESKLPSETMDYEKFFPFDDTEGVCIYNEVGKGHIAVPNVKECETTITTCTDTDGGNNIYEKGTTCRPSTVTPGALFCKTDVCLSAHITGVATSIEHSLIEYYCNGDTMISKTVACANGCNDGACLGGPGPISPVCGDGLCETNKGETGLTCPQDCCVDNDGVCRDGCTSVNDNDCPVIRSLDVSRPQRPFGSWGDLWFSTWADDDSLFASWGDGTGPNSEPPFSTVFSHPDYTHHGLARITGTFPNVEAEVVQRYMPLSDDVNNSKPTSLLFLDGRLYVAIHNPLMRPEKGFIAYSDDYGATFQYETDTHRTESENRNFICLMFINMGRAYDLNEDGYVYAFGTDAEVHMEHITMPHSESKDMFVYLARMPRQSILDYSSWTYFSGMNASNEPRWTSDYTEAVVIPGLSDTIDRPWPDYPMIFSSIFHPGIQRYIALTATIGQGELFESPKPWGPWVSIGRWFEKDDGTQWYPAYMPGIVPKDTGQSSFYFVGAGQDSIWTGSTEGVENYKFRIGQISMAVCGNGVCEAGETPQNCPQDCPAEAGCTDTDGGNNIYEKGTTCRPSTVTPGALFCKTDVCLSAHITGVATSIEHSLIEYYCNGDTMISKTVACANGCADGACLGGPGPIPPVCGNGVCEQEKGETPENCPEDCCVDGDGVCREGCAIANDDDCEDMPITIDDLKVGIHLENTGDWGDDAPEYIEKVVDDIGCQLVSRAWSCGSFEEYSKYGNWSSHAKAANDAGAFFGAWQGLARMWKEYPHNKAQEELLTDIEFNDYSTRGADGESHGTNDACRLTYDSAVANEAYLDFKLAGAYAQIDAGANAIHYDEMSSGDFSSPEGKVGYDDYGIGIANFCRPCSVNPTAIADSHSGNYIPANAIDGDISTYWVSSEETGPHWLEIDLSTNRTIQQVSLSLDSEQLLTSYNIQYWDGTNWINLVTETNNSYEHPSYLVEPAYTTKIRLYTTQHPVVVSEFRAFGQGFRQYLIEKYGEDYDWEGEFNIDLTLGGKQCPDGTINYFNYREYLADNGWSGHEIGENNPRGSHLAYYPSFNPLFSDWVVCPSYLLWTDTNLSNCDPGVGKCAQFFVPSKDEEILLFYLYLKADEPSDDLIVEIQSDNNNKPSGEILASAIVSGKGLSTEGRYIRYPILLGDLTTLKGVIIEGKNKHWIVAYTNRGSNEYLWQGSGDGAGATQELQGIWTTQPGGLFYEVLTIDDYSNESKIFRSQRNERVRNYIFGHTREYGATKGRTVYVTANGINPSTDYNDLGEYNLPVEDMGAAELHLEGDKVQISYWKMKKAWAQRTSNVPNMMFLDYAFTAFPFQDLATQEEREAFLRIYVPEMYASGLLFSYPVKMSWGYKAYMDWNAEHTSTTYDAIVQQSKFFNAHFSIYKDAVINTMEQDVKVKNGQEWITPSNDGKANETKVSFALMNAKHGNNTYLHVINHDWDSDAHKMDEQTNIEIFIPLPGGVDITSMNIISPDFSGKVSINWISKDNGAYITLPSLTYYNIVVIETTGTPAQPVCGNGICEAGETYENCPEDCPAEAGCTDTDGGQNIYVKGTACRPSTVTPGSLFCQTDKCLLATYLVEYYCNGDTMISKTVACANGCNDGACKQQEQQQCAGEGEQVNRNPLMGSIGQQCCAGLVENRVSKSYSICEKSATLMEGDVDLNGCVSLADKELLNSHIAGTAIFTSDQLECADVNDDGYVMASDVSLLASWLYDSSVLLWQSPADDHMMKPVACEDLCGDVNCDGNVNTSDGELLHNYVGYPGQYTICNEWAADVNCDGNIDMGDVILLRYYLAYSGEYTLECCSYEPTPATCTDTDGGNNIYEKGTTCRPSTVKSGLFCMTDECVSARGLKEYYCDEQGGLMLKSVYCNYACENGACVQGRWQVGEGGEGGEGGGDIPLRRLPVYGERIVKGASAMFPSNASIQEKIDIIQARIDIIEKAIKELLQKIQALK